MKKSFMIIAFYAASLSEVYAQDSGLIGSWDGTFACEENLFFTQSTNFIRFSHEDLLVPSPVLLDISVFATAPGGEYDNAYASVSLLTEHDGQYRGKEIQRVIDARLRRFGDTKFTRPAYTLDGTGDEITAQVVDTSCVSTLRKTSGSHDQNLIDSQHHGARLGAVSSGFGGGFGAGEHTTLSDDMSLIAGPFGNWLIYKEKDTRHCLWRLLPGETSGISMREQVVPRQDCSAGRVALRDQNRRSLLLFEQDGQAINIQLSSIQNLEDQTEALVEAINQEMQSSERERTLSAAEPDSQSSFAGLEIEVGDVALGMEIEAAIRRAYPDHRMSQRTWAVSRVPGSERTVFDSQRIGSSVLRGVSDQISVNPTGWHTGQLVQQVTRTIESSDPALMPARPDFLNSVRSQFGETFTERRVNTGAGFTRGLGFTTNFLQYSISEGTLRRVNCFDVATSLNGTGSNRDLARSRHFAPQRDRSRQEYTEFLAGLLEQMDNGVLCSAAIEISYVMSSTADRLRSYTITAKDFRLRIIDILSEYEQQALARQGYEEGLGQVESKF
jgi:hypothetical protein